LCLTVAVMVMMNGPCSLISNTFHFPSRYYTLAHAAHLAYTAIVVGRQIAGFTPVTKAELTTVLASVLKQSKYHDANDNYVSTSHPKVKIPAYINTC